MQVVYKNENKRDISRRVGIMNSNICIRRIGRYFEGEYFEESKNKRIEVSNSRRFPNWVEKKFGSK